MERELDTRSSNFSLKLIENELFTLNCVGSDAKVPDDIFILRALFSFDSHSGNRNEEI